LSEEQGMGKRNRNRSNERGQPGKTAVAGKPAAAADDAGRTGSTGDSAHGRAGVEQLQTAGSGLPGGDGMPRSEDIRGVLIQVAGARLLLPNATIAEVLSYADPEPVADAPDWLLGRIRWRGWQLPLVAFSRLTGIAGEQGGLGSKVLVVKAFGGNPKLPYFALLTQGFPRLVTVSRQALVAVDGEALPDAVLAEVMLNQDQALLPDIERIEALLGEALAQAA
jgi:chemosensory pili system protein ChpC